MTLKYSRIERDGKKPQQPFYASNGAAGIDLTVFGGDVSLAPGSHTVVKTGICVAIPDGYVGLIFIRSSLGVKKGITLSNSVGVIDSDYRGELLVSLYNASDKTVDLSDGDRVAQLVLVPCPRHELVECDELDATQRGSGRFGSTGT